MPCLVLSRQGRPLMQYPLKENTIGIGRDPSNTIQLLDDEISRYHCCIEWSRDHYTIISKAKNGTIVNNREILIQPLTDGDCIKIGPWEIRLSTGLLALETETVIKEAFTTKVLNFNASEETLTTLGIKITIKTNNAKTIRDEFSQEMISIGSSPSNDLVIKDDPYISRRHCTINCASERPMVKDSGSRNGTFLNNNRIEEGFLPQKGVLSIGHTEIRFEFKSNTERIKPVECNRFGTMIGKSRQMREIFALIGKVSKSSATVCITGESGTGKELIAKSIHTTSARADRPFVALNCGALPANIIESELFGHERGAFTGAANLHHGVFEQADGGTLFLDEIGEMPSDLQTRLLRVLETRQVRRVGGHKDIPVDVRIIAATNQDLKKLVTVGRFREDIFFRLYIIPIHLPPLRERREDVPLLAEHFLNELSLGETATTLSDLALAKLIEYDWPGNIRELKNVIQRAILYSKHSEIAPSEILLTPLELPREADSFALEASEKDVLLKALNKHRGNIKKTASALNISRTTLANKIKKYDIAVSATKVAR